MQTIEIVGVRSGTQQKTGKPFVQIAFTEHDPLWRGVKAGDVYLDPAVYPDANRVNVGDVAEAVIVRRGPYVNCYHFAVKLGL